MNQFRKLVKAAGWSQAKVARRLQITPGAVSQLCSGRVRPRASTLELLRLVIEEEKRLKLSDHAALAKLKPWETQLLELMGRLPKPRRDWVLAGFKALIKAFETKARFDNTPARPWA